MQALLELLVWLLVAGVVLYAINLIVGMLALPSQVKTIVLLIVGIVFLIFILRALGIFVL